MSTIERNSGPETSPLQPLEDIRQRHLQLASLAEELYRRGQKLPPLAQIPYTNMAVGLIGFLATESSIPGSEPSRVTPPSLGESSPSLPKSASVSPSSLLESVQPIPPEVRPEVRSGVRKVSEIPEGYISIGSFLPENTTAGRLAAARGIAKGARGRGEIDCVRVDKTFYYPEEGLQALLAGIKKKT